jgi:PadR family transcriptional regulator, regulatory protein PadR
VDERTELLQGTLDLLVLRILEVEPMHGWGIGERIQERSGQVFHVNQGSLYPALQRMRRRGWITAEWRRTENNRRARYYALTSAGRARLRDALAEWRRSSGAVERILSEGWAGA